jgi:NTE family protein
MSDVIPHTGEAELDSQPVRYLPGESPANLPRPGIALTLSGGGYRAMVFHLGALMRLNETGYLKKLSRVSSVSGGSITAAMLGLHWKQLAFGSDHVATKLFELVIKPIFEFAGVTIDEGSIVGGMLNPFKSIPDEIAEAYRKHLFARSTLQDLPSDNEGPRFVINATNVQTKVLWRFSKPYIADYRVGMLRNPETELAVAVGASSAFPPVLSPVRLKFAPNSFDPTTAGDLQREPYTTDVFLTDGGVYDNLGLETAWKEYDTILISDGGGLAGDEPKPHADWFQHARRILDVIDNQVGSLRKRQAIASFINKERTGVYWGIRTDIANYQLSDSLNCPYSKTIQLANIPTRLKAMDEVQRQRLVNWGYAVSDAGLRKHVDPSLGKPVSLPYSAAGVG